MEQPAHRNWLILRRSWKRSCKSGQWKAFCKDKKFWDDQLDALGEPLYSDIQGPSVLEGARKRHGDPKLRASDIEMNELFVAVKDYHLEPYATQNLMDFCMNHQLSMTNLLLLGIRTYLSKVNNGQEDITIQNFISRRSTHDEWTSGEAEPLCFRAEQWSHRRQIFFRQLMKSRICRIEFICTAITIRHLSWMRWERDTIHRSIPAMKAAIWPISQCRWRWRMKCLGLFVSTPNGLQMVPQPKNVSDRISYWGWRHELLLSLSDCSSGRAWHGTALLLYDAYSFKGIAEPDMSIGEIMEQV